MGVSGGLRYSVIFGNGHIAMLVVVYRPRMPALTVGCSKVVLAFIVVLYSGTSCAASTGIWGGMSRLRRRTWFRIEAHVYVVVIAVNSRILVDNGRGYFGGLGRRHVGSGVEDRWGGIGRGRRRLNVKRMTSQLL